MVPTADMSRSDLCLAFKTLIESQPDYITPSVQIQSTPQMQIASANNMLALAQNNNVMNYQPNQIVSTFICYYNLQWSPIYYILKYIFLRRNNNYKQSHIYLSNR